MNYRWLDEYLQSKTGAKKDYKMEWEAFRYLVGGKMFAMQGEHKDGRPIITLKCEPEFGTALRTLYPEKIIPGYYMNKEHWNSLYLESDVPDETVREMADRSYALIFCSLPKKLQKEIQNESVS